MPFTSLQKLSGSSIIRIGALCRNGRGHRNLRAIRFVDAIVQIVRRSGSIVRRSRLNQRRGTRSPLVQAPHHTQRAGEQEAVETQPKVSEGHKDAPLSEPTVDGILEEAVVGLDGTLYGGQDIHEAERPKNEQRGNNPHPVLPSVHATEAKDGKTQEHNDGYGVHEFHRSLVLPHATFLPIAIVLIDRSAEEEVPPGEHGTHLPLFLSSVTVPVHLLVASHAVTALEVPPTTKLRVTVVIPIVVVVVVPIILVFVLLLLVFVLVVLTVVSMVLATFGRPLRHGDDHGEGGGGEPSQ